MKRLILVVAVIALAASGSVASSAGPAVRICHWGGTVDAPTGDVTVTPGLTSTPSAQRSHLHATGSLTGGGRCHGTMTFDGFVSARSTCAQQWFFGRVYGLAGVARFSGPGSAGLVHEFLFDASGKIVGADQPILQVPQPRGYSHVQSCTKPQGFTHAVFSSTVELWG